MPVYGAQRLDAQQLNRARLHCVDDSLVGHTWLGRPVTGADRSARLRLAPPIGRVSTPMVRMPRTRLVDRDREVSRIRSWLLAPDDHLLTVSGPGGCGKTRLAVEAIRIGQRSGIETAFVPLADVTESSMIEFAIGRALGITMVFDGDLEAAIAAVVSDGRWVLILDNAEHLVEAVVDVVVRLRTIAPDLSVLVTSRRRLRLDDEAVLALGPLTVPEPADDLARIGGASSVQLFCERVDAVVAGFEFAAGNA